MAELKHRLVRLERLLHATAAKRQGVCSTCQGVDLFVFDDDPENLWPYGPNGCCLTCGQLAPERIDVRWSRDCPELRQFFADMLFANDQCHGKLQRVMLLMAVLKDDNLEEAERVVMRLYARNGKRPSDKPTLQSHVSKRA